MLRKTYTRPSRDVDEDGGLECFCVCVCVLARSGEDTGVGGVCVDDSTIRQEGLAEAACNRGP